MVVLYGGEGSGGFQKGEHNFSWGCRAGGCASHRNYDLAKMPKHCYNDSNIDIIKAVAISIFV